MYMYLYHLTWWFKWIKCFFVSDSLGRAEDSKIKIFSVGGRRNGDQRERTESSDGAQEEYEGITKKSQSNVKLITVMKQKYK